jgi:hypothetical protein
MPALGSASWHVVWRGYISIKVKSDHGAERASHDADVSIVPAKILSPIGVLPARRGPKAALSLSLWGFECDGLTRKGET